MLNVFIEKMQEGIQPRFPRGPIEGAIKGTLVGGTLLMMYDRMSDPSTLQEAKALSQFIVTGYIVFVTLGTILGAIGWATESLSRRLRPE